jgi:hypothetical protein
LHIEGPKGPKSNGSGSGIPVASFGTAKGKISKEFIFRSILRKTCQLNLLKKQK